MTGFELAGGASLGRAGLGVLNALGAGICARGGLSLTRSTVAGPLSVWSEAIAALLGGRRGAAGVNGGASYARRAAAKLFSCGCKIELFGVALRGGRFLFVGAAASAGA
jgi:hypothetical protein